MSKKNKGFTLIEMAVVIMIIGFLAVAFSQVYALRVKHLRLEDTVVDIKNVQSAIAGFRNTNGRYPCPAPLTVTPDTLGLGNTYGREGDCADESIPLGSCVNGVCIQESMRDDITFTSGGVTIGPDNVRIRVGAVPFRNLNLEEENSYDGYGNRILYVVTERLAVADRFDARIGGISIMNQEDTTAIEPYSSAHFFVMSAGEDQEGAFTRAGQRLNCDNTTSQGENCHITCFIPVAAPPGTPPTCNIDTQAEYRAAERNESDSAERFDDTVDYFLEAEIPLWQTSEADMNNIHQKPTGNVGFFVNSAFSMSERGEVEGDVRAFDTPANPGGKVMVDQVCSQDGTDCFPLTKITGAPDDADALRQSLHCGPNEYMTQIANGTQVCATQVQLTCPSGRYMVGVNNDGSLNCAAPPAPGCPTQGVGICGTTRFLPPTAHNGTANVTAGTSRVERYRCRNGTWSLLSTSGSCTCTPGVVSTTGGLACGSGYTGTYTSTVTRTCPAGTTTTTTTRAADCVCVARAPETRTRACPSGLTGAITDTRTWTCTTPTSGSWGSWVETANTCTCTPTTATQNVSCPAGLTGTIRQERTRVCPSGAWGPWINIDDPATACTCTERTDTRTQSCPTGYQGEIIQETRFQCPSATWTAWTDVSNTCAPVPPRICNWNAVSAPQNNQTNSQGANITSSCTCGDSGACYRRITPGNFTVYMVCSCD